MVASDFEAGDALFQVGGGETGDTTLDGVVEPLEPGSGFGAEGSRFILPSPSPS